MQYYLSFDKNEKETNICEKSCLCDVFDVLQLCQFLEMFQSLILKKLQKADIDKPTIGLRYFRPLESL